MARTTRLPLATDHYSSDIQFFTLNLRSTVALLMVLNVLFHFVTGGVSEKILASLGESEEVDTELSEEGSYAPVEGESPSEDSMHPVDEDSCPRSREDASAKGRSCLRKCKSDADCISSRKRCLCDGLCGWSCIRPDLHCEELKPIENGHFTVTGDYFGAKVTYTCDEGFWMSGSRERFCQGDTSWSDAPPVCRKKAVCGKPPTVNHARHSGLLEKEDYDIDAMVQYTCFPGYDSQGFARSKCLFHNNTAKWFGPDLKCIPRSCGPPGDVENGRREGTTYTFTSRVTYLCLDGYELVGRANRYCQSNGQWSGLLPSCRPVQCTIPTDPTNGRALYTAVTFNAVVKYECRYGYRLNGPVTRKCGALKVWEGTEPTCDEIDCGSPGILHNGYLESRSTSLGSVIIFRCFEGMKYEGESVSTTCQQDGKWSHPLPKCLSSCVVPTIDHSNGTIVPPGSRVEHGQEITVDCKPHYEPAYNATPATCRNGTWTHVPVCGPERCKQLPDRPRHGMVIAPKTEHGMRALFKCKDGFELEGVNVTECHYGKWTAPTPRCKEIYCKFPGYLDNGRVLLVGHMGMYDYRPYVRKVTNNRQIVYECHRGYAIQEGPPGATCVAGHWSPQETPRCLPGSHPSVRFQRDARRKRRQLRNQRMLRMLSDEIESNPKSKKGGAKGLLRRRGRRRFRRDKGPCSPIPEAPWMEVEIIKLGKGNSTMIPHGTVVNVTCSKGYRLSIGDNRTTAKCAHGQWKPAKPECLTLPCHVPAISHGIYHHFQDSLEPGAHVSHGELVTLTCVPGFRVTGAESVRCWYGEWAVDNLPDCVPGPCQLPAIVEGHYLGGYRAGLTISHGASVDYACKGDWFRKSEEPIRCTEGRLEPEAPSCQHPSSAKSGSVPGRDSIQESETKFKQPEGSTVSVVDFSGSGSGNLPTSAENTARSPLPRGACSLPERLQNSILYPTMVKAGSNQPIVKNSATTDNFDVSEPEPAEVESPLLGDKYLAEGEVETDTGTTSSTTSIPETSSSSSSTGEEEGGQLLGGGTFPNGAEIRFRCIAGITGEKTTWSIVCEDGSWVGRANQCEDEVQTAPPPEERRNKTCIFRNSEPNVIAFHGDRRIVEETTELPPDTELVFRCKDIGKFTLIGSVRRRCRYGDWDGVKPSCFGLSQENDYALEKPPTILFRNQVAPIAQSNDGKLIVYPGAILHLECLWIRKYGTPTWEVSHSYRKYPEGWTNEPNRDPQLEYRLSIYHAQRDDTGRYTCVSPMGHRHSVDLVVAAIHCPPLAEVPGLHISNSNTRMTTEVAFTCRDGQTLYGSQHASCLPSGNWSDPVPHCEVTECPDLVAIVNNASVQVGNTTTLIGSKYEGLDMNTNSRNVGATATFSCPKGYGLRGSPQITCLDTGQWSDNIPECEEVICDIPEAPENGYIQGLTQREYRGGDVLQFACNTGFMMDGTAIVVCQENSRWSGPAPPCIPACTYPGTAAGATIVNVQFYYRINETVTFDCAEGLELRGARMLRCLENGRWSSAIPSCTTNRKGR